MKYSLQAIILFLFGLSISNYVFVTHAQTVSVISQIFSLFLLMYVPGILSILILKLKLKENWLYILHSLGLSVTWIFFLGLIVSYSTKAGITRPLDLVFYASTQLCLVTCLSIVALVRHSRTRVSKEDIISTVKMFCGYIVISIVSSVSIIGAFALNQSQFSNFSLFWILLLTISFGLVGIFQKKNSDLLNPYIVFALSLSILWTLSVRSVGLIGWDIVQEYGVAHTTISAAKWSMETSKDAYNACLSITLLPAILANQTSLSVEFIFKFLYPFIFAHFVVAIYFFCKKFARPSTALFASFYIIAQPFFIQPMVGLARQEIAFLFFMLLLLTIYNESLKGKVKIALVVFYTFALVVSHYSTSYMAIILFGCVFLSISSLQVIKKISIVKKLSAFVFYRNWVGSFSSSYKWWMFGFLCGFTYLWYFLITHSAGNLSSTFFQTLNNMSSLFAHDQQSQEVRKSLPGATDSNLTTQSDLDLFAREFTTRDFENNLTPEQVNEILQRYPIKPINETYILPSIQPKLAQLIRTVLNFYKDGLKILVILGALVLALKTFFSVQDEKTMDLALLASASTGFLLLMLFHPTLGVNYNISRGYLQLLIFLSLPMIMLFELCTQFLHEKLRLTFFSVMFFICFLSLQGLLVPLIGGVPALQFYNVGTDYEKFYIFQGELAAAKWLSKNRDTRRTVYADQFTGLRLRKEASFFPNPIILPLVIANNGSSYVYLSATNTNILKAQVSYNNKVLTYQYPTQLLEDKKDLVYSNSKSKIFK